MPQDCLICGEAAQACGVCADCIAELPRRPSAACPVCALPALDGGACGRCLSEAPAYDATLALFDYAFPVDVLIHALKYRQQLSVATFLAEELLALGGPVAASADLILPMPLHVRRLAGRGFNQAVELARPLARSAGLPLELAGVRKTRDTPPQASLSRNERLLSPGGAFRCGRKFDGLHVLVVDDVMTTGATLDELAHCLKAQGAARVTNLVVARTPVPA